MNSINVVKHCYQCQYEEEILSSVPEPVCISINLTSENNVICKRCQLRTIRLDIEETGPSPIIVDEGKTLQSP